jgi:hypothetical protein
MRIYLLGALAAVASLSSTLAGTHRLPKDEPFARIDLPDKWRTEIHDEFIEATSPGGAVHVLVTTAELNKINESIGEVMQYVRGKGEITFKSETIRQKPITINGAELKTVSWEGKDKNEPVRITFTILPMTGHEPLVFASWAAPREEEKQKAVVKKMLESIKQL